MKNFAILLALTAILGFSAASKLPNLAAPSSHAHISRLHGALSIEAKPDNLIEEIIAQANATIRNVTASINVAAAAITSALEAEAAAALPLIDAIISNAVNQSEVIIANATAEILNSTIAEAVGILVDALSQLDGVVNSAIAKIQLIVEEAELVAPKIKTILNQLAAEVAAAVQPLLDLINQLVPTTPSPPLA